MSHQNYTTCTDLTNNVYQIPNVDRVIYYHFDVNFADLENTALIFLSI